MNVRFSLFLLISFSFITAQEFSLVTSNVLFPAWYISYATKQVIHSQERLKSFEKYAQLYKEKGADIVCFQEWPYGNAYVDNKEEKIGVVRRGTWRGMTFYNLEQMSKQEHFDQSGNQFRQGMHDIINKLFPSSDYYHITDPYKAGEDGLFVLINKKKFTLLESIFKPFPGYKQDNPVNEGESVNISTMTFKADPTKTLAVLSSHVAWNADNSQNLKYIAALIQSSTATYKIACGDFNYDCWDLADQAPGVQTHEELKKIFALPGCSVQDLPHPTARRGQNNVAMILDYVLYQGIKSKEINLYPEALRTNKVDSLIPHTTGDEPLGQQPFFYSDHGALSYTFVTE